MKRCISRIFYNLDEIDVVGVLIDMRNQMTFEMRVNDINRNHLKFFVGEAFNDRIMRFIENNKVYDDENSILGGIKVIKDVCLPTNKIELIYNDRDEYEYNNFYLPALKTAINSIYGLPKVDLMSSVVYNKNIYKEEKVKLNKPEIKDVKFNGPATIVFWSDNTKTIVKCEDEDFDKEKGLAMAISKKFLGSNKSGSNYYDIFKKFA